ncbi:MAG: ABC transporter substrate-binding protein [Archaeoglobaceae archaeon]
MKWKWLSSILLLVLMFSLCSQPQESSHFNTSLDDTRYPVVEGYRTRIVSLAPSITEILFALGAGDRVVGVTEYCNYPPEVLKLKKEGKIQTIGGYSTVNVEKVVSLNPDIVIATYGNGIETIETLRKTFKLYVIAFDPKNVSDVERQILTIGKAIGNYDEAEKLVENMEKRLRKVEEEAKKIEKKKVVHILWNDPIYVSGKETFIDEAITLAGGENAFNFSGWKIVSIEDIISANPDVVIVNSGGGMGGGEDLLYKWFIGEKRFQAINATKNGKVFIIDADLISRPSYRIVDAIEQIQKFLR